LLGIRDEQRRVRNVRGEEVIAHQFGRETVDAFSVRQHDVIAIEDDLIPRGNVVWVTKEPFSVTIAVQDSNGAVHIVPVTPERNLTVVRSRAKFGF
jgi:hypothetical protein